MVESITLYVDQPQASPFGHRVAMALEEVGARYTKYQVDLTNKPAWFAEKVNPVSKIPAIAYGGPNVPADQPSPESTKLAESIVILEFLADLFPESTLLPKDPILRAKTRYFVEISRNVVQPWLSFVFRAEDPEFLAKALEDMQKILPTDAKFAMGDAFTMADIAFAPIVARVDLMMRNDIGAFGEAAGKELAKTLTAPKFARLWKYLADVKARESFQKTFDEPKITQRYITRVKQVKDAAKKA